MPRLFLPRLILVLALIGLAAPTARAGSTPQELVDQSRAALEDILNDPNLSASRDYLAGAKGVMIIPNMIKAGFLIGGQGGSGVVLARGKDGRWSDPAFYMFAAASIGLQIGVEKKQILFILMTDKALGSVMTEQIKLGADVSVSAGPVGAGASASSVGSLRADIVAFSKSQGLFGGGALDGALITPLKEHNTGYYAAERATPKSILLDRRHSNAGAVVLKQLLAKYQ